MVIPVSHLTQYGRIIGSVLYDSDTNKFSDSRTVYDRSLPLQDYSSCCVTSNKCVTIVGRILKRSTYVCCFGDNFCYELTKQDLIGFTLSNMTIDKRGSLHCIDGKLPDLGYLFPDSRIKFVSSFYGGNQSSRGVSRKFSATFKGKLCIVKFTKSKNEDLRNEIIYKDVCTMLNIPCCDVILSNYYGRPCIISLFHYNSRSDVYFSFKSTNKSLGDILLSLSDEDKRLFDKYMLLDYILLQEDRHYSNLALVNNKLYPLFDNGECLGYSTISTFSRSFRKYIERLDNRYLRSLFFPTKDAFRLLNPKQLQLVQAEVQKIW